MIAAAYKYYSNGKFNESRKILEDILSKQHRNIEAIQLLGVIFAVEKKFEEAAEILSKGIRLNPSDAQLLYNRGNVYADSGKYIEAIADLEKSLLIFPNNPDAYFVKGNAFAALLRNKEAIQSYFSAFKLRPQWPQLLVNIGNIFTVERKFIEAKEYYKKAIKIDENFKNGYLNLGSLYLEAENLEQALENFNKAISLDLYFAEAYFNRGQTYLKFNLFESAIKDYLAAININQNYAQAFIGIGVSYGKLNKYNEAIINLEKAIKLDGINYEAFINLAVMQNEIGENYKAIENFNKAIAIDPNNEEAHYNKGNALQQLGKLNEAIACYENAIKLKRNFARAYNNCGSAYMTLGKIEESYIYFKQANTFAEEGCAYLGGYLSAKMFGCEWGDYELIRDKILLSIQEEINLEIPFSSFLINALTDSGQLLSKSAVINNGKLVSKITKEGRSYKNKIPSQNVKKIKIAFISGDFKEHPMAYNCVGLFENLDRDKFEVIAVSFFPIMETHLGKRLLRAFDQIEVVTDKSNIEICEYLHNIQVDIAVDMMGNTANNREEIFEMRCAPIQVNMYLWASGSRNMEYILSDPISMPSGYEKWLTEKIAFMPHTVFTTDDKKEISNEEICREKIGLPKENIIFCCFNNSYKITPEIFKIWMSIMMKVPDSILWIRSAGNLMENNLIKEAEKFQIDPKRIVFAGAVESMAEHLARYRLADIFLDTYPFCAQTTASDALWAGLPIVTYLGNSPFSRISASLLYAVGMSELVAETLEDYEYLVVEIAQNPSKLKSLKVKLLNNRSSTPLFNTSLYAKHLGKLFEKMYKRHLDNLSAENIHAL